jgi:hypothetical protein
VSLDGFTTLLKKLMGLDLVVALAVNCYCHRNTSLR